MNASNSRSYTDYLIIRISDLREEARQATSSVEEMIKHPAYLESRGVETALLTFRRIQDHEVFHSVFSE